MPNRLGIAGSALLLAAALSACSSTSSGHAVAVSATDSACSVGQTTFPSGSTTFDVENKGSNVTEVYVYAAGDKVMTEKENIGPGTTASFSVNLPTGEYEVACKPGQTGNGIRTKITVTGAAAAGAKAADRAVEVSAKEFSFGGLEGFGAKPGETVGFDLKNDGTVDHEIDITGPDGSVVGEINDLAPGASGTANVTFDKPGTYTYKCDVDSHASYGMKGSFTVG